MGVRASFGARVRLGSASASTELPAHKHLRLWRPSGARRAPRDQLVVEHDGGDDIVLVVQLQHVPRGRQRVQLVHAQAGPWRRADQHLEQACSARAAGLPPGRRRLKNQPGPDRPPTWDLGLLPPVALACTAACIRLLQVLVPPCDSPACAVAEAVCRRPAGRQLTTVGHRADDELPAGAAAGLLLRQAASCRHSGLQEAALRPPPSARGTFREAGS